MYYRRNLHAQDELFLLMGFDPDGIPTNPIKDIAEVYKVNIMWT
jgi:hypothetical protein